MARILFFLSILMVWGCQESSIPKENLRYLNGYWEIAEVQFPDGSKKEYGVNPTIDFIQLDNGTGFRKKMQPRFNGTYKTSHDVELLTVSEVEAIFILRYSSEFSDWEETLVQVDSTSFSVVNQEGVTYSYKRFEPIKIPK
ncbi:hypothetical protein [Flagellimonas sp. SN16]|uniref:hypothetical protein n=1 Tax=Flagellimonas sp. SN16 TaxID=3415142 RepID=UPI003C325395